MIRHVLNIALIFCLPFIVPGSSLFAVANYEPVDTSLQEQLQGTWICTRIIDNNKLDRRAKYGESGDYIKFRFRRNLLRISRAPFDEGESYTVVYDDNKQRITLPLPVSNPAAEPYYTVISCSANVLVLRVLNIDLQEISYIFIRQRTYNERADIPDTLDLGAVIIKHTAVFEEDMISKDAEYYIRSKAPLLYPTPVFRQAEGFGLRDEFTKAIKLPDHFPVDTLSSGMVISFVVGRKGASEIGITSDFDKEFEKQVVRFFKRKRRKWKPITIQGEPVPVVVRLHTYFFFRKSEMRTE